jgi:hypothetical protein
MDPALVIFADFCPFPKIFRTLAPVTSLFLKFLNFPGRFFSPNQAQFSEDPDRFFQHPILAEAA